MKYKTLIVIIVITSILLVIGLVLYKPKEKKTNKKVVGNLYNIPVISKVTNEDDYINIYASHFMYGDINLDHAIDKYDLELYDIILNNNFLIDDNQIILGDLNSDRKITSDDQKILDEYLEKEKEKNYDDNEKLLYCATDKSSAANCNWQEDSSLKVVDDTYIYVKDVSEQVSNVYKYQYVEKIESLLGK